MVKKMAETSTSSEQGREVTVPPLTLKLSKMNYHVWSMAMEFYLDSHNLWQAVVTENVTKKDFFAPSEIISGVLEDLLGILDAKKSAKENWKILRQRNLAEDKVIQSHIQGFKHDFEMLTVVKTNSIMDFVIKFTHIICDI